MVGISRTRKRGGKYFHGVLKLGINPEASSSVISKLEVCNDVIGNPMGQNPFDLLTTICNPVILNGHNGLTGTSEKYFIDYPAGGTTTIPGHLVFAIPLRDATQAIASSHPGESRVSLPLFAYELKDLPMMLRSAAERARALHNIWKHRGWKVSHRRLSKYYTGRRHGEDWLMYQFGWLPFFSDIHDMMGIDDFLKHRKKKFKSVRGTELRTSGERGNHTMEENKNWTIQSLSTSVSGPRNMVTTRSGWWSARWKIDPIRFGASLQPGYKDSLMDMLGLDNSLPITIWEAMPWSWLSDWVFNVGSILKLLGNWQGCRFQDAVLMTRTRTVVTYHVAKCPPWLGSTSGDQVRDTKVRSLFTPSFTRTDAGYNILQPAHLATIASLRVTRGSGSSRF